MSKLSLSKFSELLTKHSYSLISTYCAGDECRFLEVKTPTYQKTFVIYVPEKYKMVVTTDVYRRLCVGKATSIQPHALSYLVDMKGPLLECDLLSISSTTICVYRHNGTTQCYPIGGSIKIDEVEPKEEVEKDEEDPIKKIESDAVRLIEKLDPGAQHDIVVEAKPIQTTEKEITFAEVVANEPPVVVINTAQNVEKVELVFEDNEAEEPVEIAVKQKDTASSKPIDNSLPSTLEDEEISLGIVYVMVDLPTFLRKVETCEEEIVNCYDALDDNEVETRSQKVKEITTLVESATKKLTEELDKIAKEEVSRKGQLIHLTAVLTQLEKLSSKTKDIKYATERPEVERVTRQTKNTIHEFNVATLRLRDRADELLTAYITSLKELLTL
jgi:hypothetical protein